MEYKYETHCHTKNTSRCGKLDGKKIAELYKAAGYDGIVITDHYSPMTFDAPDFFNHKRAMNHYLAGYRSAKEAADENFTVLLGMELRFNATVNDYLVYGVTEDFFYKTPSMLPFYVKRASKILHKSGCLFLQAHPFRPLIYRANPKYLDGVEVFNGKTSKELNDKALLWAKENNLDIQIGGSDCHSVKQLGTSGIITHEKISSNDDLLRILKNKEFEIIKNAY